MNCAAMPENLIEAELFGHVAGSFTGAAKTRHGRFEEADGGTLFLDELATLSSPAQDRLLRAVEYGEVTRIGASKPIEVDVRIVAATNEHLPRLVEEGRFRADLLDRLAFDVIHVPPLRARPEDIDTLAYHFAVNVTAELKRSFFPGFTTDAKAALLGYAWPGNVRELKNAVERSVYRAEEPDKPIDKILFDPFASPYALAAPRTSEPETDPIVAPLRDHELPSDFRATPEPAETTPALVWKLRCKPPRSPPTAAPGTGMTKPGVWCASPIVSIRRTRGVTGTRTAKRRSPESAATPWDPQRSTRAPGMSCTTGCSKFRRAPKGRYFSTRAEGTRSLGWH